VTLLATTAPTGTLVLVTAVFLASAVEMVEALTIVLAVGVTRGWRSAFEGVAVALVTLAGLVAVFGPALVHWVPLSTLRLVVGALLLVFGLQWLRKAILRAAGLKAKHDEDAIFADHVAELTDAPPTSGRDATAFAVAFKGVFLEGLEVVVIVITLGTTSHRLGLAAAAAGAAALVVCVVGLVVHRQLSGVPENAMKMGVGLMLVSFGTFWSAEGVRATWPGSDLAIPILVAFYGLSAWVLVAALRRRNFGRTAPGVAVAGGPGHV
jgi:Ca2+/H+ antiporter, TMEM165/GDT1 family